MVGDLVQLKHDFRFIAQGFPFPVGDLALEGLLALQILICDSAILKITIRLIAMFHHAWRFMVWYQFRKSCLLFIFPIFRKIFNTLIYEGN